MWKDSQRPSKDRTPPTPTFLHDIVPRVLREALAGTDISKQLLRSVVEERTRGADAVRTDEPSQVTLLN